MHDMPMNTLSMAHSGAKWLSGTKPWYHLNLNDLKKKHCKFFIKQRQNFYSESFDVD